MTVIISIRNYTRVQSIGLRSPGTDLIWSQAVNNPKRRELRLCEEILRVQSDLLADTYDISRAVLGSTQLCPPLHCLGENGQNILLASRTWLISRDLSCGYWTPIWCDRNVCLHRNTIKPCIPNLFVIFIICLNMLKHVPPWNIYTRRNSPPGRGLSVRYLGVICVKFFKRSGNVTHKTHYKTKLMFSNSGTSL